MSTISDSTGSAASKSATSRRLLLLAPALLLALSACGTEKAAEVVADEPEATSSVVAEEPTEDTDVVTEEAPVDEEVQQTAALGETVSLASWDVKVTEVALDANRALANPNFYNEKPDGQYVLVTYEATYNGTERTADVEMDLSWSLTTSDMKIWEPDWQTTPADNEEWTSEARRGGTVKQQVVFDVNPKMLKGSILSVEAYDDNFDLVYADFAVN